MKVLGVNFFLKHSVYNMHVPVRIVCTYTVHMTFNDYAYDENKTRSSAVSQKPHNATYY